MEALKKLISAKKQAIQGREVVLKGDLEREKREQYEAEQQKRLQEEDAKLEKRLKNLDDFYDNANLINSKKSELFEPMKKVILQKKKNKKSVRQEEEKQAKVLEVDSRHRNGTRA
jgi:ssDNA-binding Zn-finger/Zn-ribbon topoisomerase 1